MTTFSWVLEVNAGAVVDVAKRVKRTMAIQATATDIDHTRHATQAAVIGAEASVALERAATWLRSGTVDAEAGLALGPKRVLKVIAINVAAGVRIRTGAKGVYSYLRLRSEIMGLEEFLTQTRHGPKGFTGFVRVYPGEYTFKDAVLRSTMLTREPTTKPKLTRLKPIVDVPDTLLQGTAEILVALDGVDIVFDPPFYTAPEVAVLWRSGSTIGVARATAPTRDGVHAYIEDPLNPGTLLTGTISYMIQGY